MHSFLILPVAVVPEWTKVNVKTYPLSRFSKDGAYMLIDNAHPQSTYTKWLGPHASELEGILKAATPITIEEFSLLTRDPSSIWYGEE